MMNSKCKKIMVLLCSVVLLSSVGCSRQHEEQKAEKTDITVVTTENGKIQGTAEEDVVVFKGVPYAKPPVNELRFAPPEKPEAWDDILECKEFKEISAQTRGDGVNGGEDCLYLNVWAPEKSLEEQPKEKLPVLVFIHGGAFAVGAASDPMFDGTAFAKDGVICVTVAYRLNMAGFLASEVLENEYGYLGNLGLLDQIESLKWVKNNIENFGGDSNNITISGESAGAMSVSALTISPLSEGLFQKAIMESGSVFTQAIVDPKSGGDAKQSIARGDALMEALGASDLKDLRALDINTMVEKSAFSMDLTSQNPLCLMPVNDGKILPEDPYSVIKNGDMHDVSVMAGYNTDEGTMFVPEGITEDTYINFVKDIFPEHSNEVLERFPVDDTHTATDRARALVKMSFQIGCQIYGNELAAHGKDAYVYNFDYHVPQYDQAGMGVQHGLEMPFVFDTFADDMVLPEDADAVTEQIHDYWVSFIKTGNPNSKDNQSPKWPKYNAGEKEILRINSDSQPIPMEDQEDLEFLTDIFFNK